MAGGLKIKDQWLTDFKLWDQILSEIIVKVVLKIKGCNIEGQLCISFSTVEL